MKKSIILKSFLVILICGMVLFTIMTPVYAADDDFEELLTSDDDTNTSNTSNTSNTNSSNTNSSNTNSSNTNSSNTNSSNTNSSNTNSSNTNSLPDTGIQDSLPTVLLIVVFAISAIYAFKKIKYYRNID